MLSIFSKVTLALFTLAFLVGCDGDGTNGSETIDAGVDLGGSVDSGTKTGLQHLANGSVYCDIPSPTGDAPYNAAAGVTMRDEMMKFSAAGGAGFIVISNASAATSTCLAWSPITGHDGFGNPIPAYCAAPQDPAQVAYCSDKMTPSSCADVSHDFTDAAGYPHCWGLTVEDGVSACSPKADGSVTCKLDTFEAVTTDPSLKVRWQSAALCSPQGAFVGWQCAS